MSEPPESKKSSILKHFEKGFLPEYLEDIRAEFLEFAEWVDETLPSGPEKSVTLRKLLESSDSAMRSALTSKIGD